MKRVLAVVAMLFFALPAVAEDPPGAEGTVTVEVLVGPDGKAKEARVTNTTLPQQFSDAAVELAKTWKYKTSTADRKETKTFQFKVNPKQ